MSAEKKTAEKVSDVQSLIDNANLPTYREAYSDRTCYIMACLSELVYIKFNEPILEPSNTKLARMVSKLLDDNKERTINKLLDLLDYDHIENEKCLEKDLLDININYIKPICNENTQAMFVEMDNFYVLVFRGTESDELSDIKTDIDFELVDDQEEGDKGRVHSGFLKDYNEVKGQILKLLKSKQDKPLLITGHSLGGALATIATKKLKKHAKIAACYTFGSPRVGNEEWIDDIKAPIYRIVNSADPVTMLPFNTDVIDVLSMVCRFIPYGRTLSKIMQKRFRGYMHVGYMRYLDDINPGEYEKARILYSVSFMRRIKGFFIKTTTTKKRSLFKLPKDHTMKVYMRKLEQIAIRRNK